MIMIDGIVILNENEPQFRKVCLITCQNSYLRLTKAIDQCEFLGYDCIKGLEAVRFCSFNEFL